MASDAEVDAMRTAVANAATLSANNASYQQYSRQQQEQQRNHEERFADFERQVSERAAEREETSRTQMQTLMAAHAETVKTLIIAAATTGQRDDAPSTRTKYADKISEKSYKRIVAFGGGESSWQDWKYDFQISTGSLNKDVAEELEYLIAQP